MKSIRYVPFFAALFGILGAVLRGLNLCTGYEPDTNLPIAGNPPQIALIALSFIFFITMLLWSLLLRNERGLSFEDAFGCKSSVYKIIVVISSLIMGISGGIGLYLLLSGGIYNAASVFSNLPFVPLWILAILTMYAFLAIATGQARGTISESRAIFTVIPMFWACFDLIITFKDNGACPFVSLYAFELFAAIFLVYAFYCMAAFLYSNSNPARFVWTASLAVFFCFISLGGYLVCGLLGGSTILLNTDAILRYACFGGSSIYLLSNLFIISKRLSYTSCH